MKEEVQVYIIELFRLLNEKFGNGHHTLELGEDGKLWLWIALDDIRQSVIFDEDYENLSPQDLVDKIYSQIKEVYPI